MADSDRFRLGAPGSAGKRPLERKIAIFLLDIALPLLAAVQIKTGQIAIAKKENDILAVRYWGRRSIIAAVFHHDFVAFSTCLVAGADAGLLDFQGHVGAGGGEHGGGDEGEAGESRPEDGTQRAPMIGH